MGYSFSLWSRYITLAFLQSKEKLKREVYVRPPKGENVLSQIGAPDGSVLKAVKPQYSLVESPGYWWQNFREWHVTGLKMKPINLDHCFFYKFGPCGLDGVQLTQVDDTCGGGSSDFSALESEKGAIFNCKTRSSSLPIKFNGIWIDSADESVFKVHQNDYAKRLIGIDKVWKSEESQKLFQSVRGKIAYIVSSTRPDLAY